MYINSYIPKIGICKVTITHKGIESQCCFFVVPRNCPVLLGMPHGGIRLQLLSINCDTIYGDQVTEQSKN